MAALTAVIFRTFADRRAAILMGLAFAAGHFHGREKRDYEVSVDMTPPHLDAYLMWRWSWDQATDFWPTAFVMLVAAVLVSLRLRRK